MPILIQVAVALALFLACAVVHGTGVVLMTKLFAIEERKVKSQRLASREFELMVPMALCLFVLHGLEILIFALFYLMVGVSAGLEQSLYLSASAYTTIGHQEAPHEAWRLVNAFEGLTGFLLIGWSAAMFVTDMEQVLRKRFD